jgi:hypothetical protein
VNNCVYLFVFRLELNNLKERNGQITSKKVMQKAKPIALAPGTFRPSVASHNNISSDEPAPLQNEKDNEEESILSRSNAFDALVEPDEGKFKFALKPSMLTSMK